jgi:hypothetical protein
MAVVLRELLPGWCSLFFRGAKIRVMICQEIFQEDAFPGKMVDQCLHHLALGGKKKRGLEMPNLRIFL